MRKKSHISLAKHIVQISDIKNFDEHKKAFYIGSILPDCKPSFLTKRHEITGTFDLVEKGMYKLTQGYHRMDELSTMYFTKLGEVMHYIADYFTFPHNIEYPGTMTEHIHYEAQLKVDFREFVQKMKEKHAHFQEVNMQSADEICTFIRKCHEEYLHAVKSVENDCRYILQICAQVVGAILHLLQQNSMPLGCYM